MRNERLSFPGSGGALLAARLDRPEGPIRATAILAHCFTCSKDIPAARRIAERLAALGIAVLRFDFTGLGHSAGEFASTGFSTNVEDLVAAAYALEGRLAAPQILVGHSLGGAAAIVAASRIPSLRALVTIGAPFEPSHVLGHIGASLKRIRESGSALVTLGDREFEIRQQFVDDIGAQRLDQALGHLKPALLVLHAPRDTVVGIDNASAIFLAARHPKSFISLDDADHLLSREEDAEYAAEVISSWVSRYLDLPVEAPRAEAPEGVVRVAEAEAGGFRQDITVGGRHQLVADEPRALGGTDLGPSPYQLLAAGLGACTTMTIRLYARRKGMALAHVACEVTHDKRHTEDCEVCDKTQPKIDVFRRLIRLEGDLSTDERESLLAIADRCPVHRTLHATSVIETALA